MTGVVAGPIGVKGVYVARSPSGVAALLLRDWLQFVLRPRKVTEFRDSGNRYRIQTWHSLQVQYGGQLQQRVCALLIHYDARCALFASL